MSTQPRANYNYDYRYPSDIPAEQRILGVLIKYPHLVDHVVDAIKPEYFYDPQNRLVYAAILDIYQHKGSISYTQLYNKLRKTPEIPAVDQVLLGMTESFVSKTELEPSVESLISAYGKRKILLAVEEIEKLVARDEGDLSSLREKAQELVFAATSELTGEDSIKTLSEVLSDCYSNLMARTEGKQSYGLTVHYKGIDARTNGFKKKDLIILAGRPSMGKTALALNFAMNIAAREIPVLVFSLEMDDEQIGDRLVISELFKHQDQNGKHAITSMEYNTRLTDTQVPKVLEVFNTISQYPIQLVDKRGLTAVEIRAKARKVKAQNPDLGLIIIDYLQLIKPPSGSNKNWALTVGDIVRELRDLAGELDVPIILLSQLNRGVESRDDKRPVMSDLRDSGNIEEFADLILFVYRDEYYHPEQAEERGSKGKAEIIIAKNRKGQTGKAILEFYPDFTRFVDVTIRQPDH